ncbi:hypothetical protein [Neobacillus drentensis]|uniref:hypothetical protein n=1 Tax=Neobacillus drentensis TaxID=220684 RepID=UPI00300210D2
MNWKKKSILILHIVLFLGFDLIDSVLDYSTFRQNKRKIFKDSTVFPKIFVYIVKQYIEKGLVTGEVIVTDSTHIKASAAKGKVEKVVVEKTPSHYLNTLELEANKIERELEEKGIKSGKKSKRKPKGPFETIFIV